MKHFPFKNKKIYLTEDSNSFVNRNFETETEIPTGNHVGAFGYIRKNHTHEGVDLYCVPNEEVFAMEDGEVVLIENFTGPMANSPWWNNTRAIHIEGESGVIVYGELIEKDGLKVGDKVKIGEHIGNVTPVLKKDKGRPMTMLHLELYEHGNRESIEWKVGEEKPQKLKNPTELLLSSIKKENQPI